MLLIKISKLRLIRHEWDHPCFFQNENLTQIMEKKNQTKKQTSCSFTQLDIRWFKGLKIFSDFWMGVSVGLRGILIFAF